MTDFRYLIVACRSSMVQMIKAPLWIVYEVYLQLIIIGLSQLHYYVDACTIYNT